MSFFIVFCVIVPGFFPFWIKGYRMSIVYDIACVAAQGEKGAGL
jgi:hypothetical protein